jgi:prophage DNA circulation protein
MSYGWGPHDWQIASAKSARTFMVRICQFSDRKYDIWLSRIEHKVDRLLAGLQTVETEMTAIDDAVAALTTQVQANTDAESSAITLIQGLATQIASLASDPAAITALAAKLKTSADSLAAAVMANTPAPPAPTT